MYKAKITNIERQRHQATNSDFLEVAFDVLDAEDAVVSSKKLGFDLEITSDELEREVANYCDGFKAIMDRREANKEKIKLEEHVTELKKLDGQVVDPEVVRKKKEEKGAPEELPTNR